MMASCKSLGRVAAIVVISIVCMAATVQAQERFDGATLRVATFGGAWRDIMDHELSPKFAALGGQLEFVTGSPQANFAKLVAGRGRAPFDVIEILDAQYPEYAAGKYLAQLDLTKIPNTKYLDPYQFNDRMIASWETQEGICYNVDKYKALGLTPPTTYKDLANPALAGHVMLPDLNSGGGLAGFAGFAYAAGGDEVNFMPGIALIKSIKGAKFWMQGDQMVLAFQSGDIYAGAAHAGWCLRSLQAGVPVQSVHPLIKPGVVGVAKDGRLGIVTTSQNIAAAHWFLNAYIDPDYQLAFAVADGVVPVSKPAVLKMGQDANFAKMLQLDPARIAHELRVDYSKVVLSDWADAWNHMITN
jgi:putative spermidine/putrescine transport system substrate-binding protein